MYMLSSLLHALFFLAKKQKKKEPKRLIKIACMDRSVKKSEDFSMKSKGGKDVDENSQPSFQ